MNQHTQQIFATTSQRAQQITQQISATSELDLPQSRFQDEDEAWPTEKANEKIQAANVAMFPQYPKTPSVSEPILPRNYEPIHTPISAAQCTINGSECDLPGPVSRYDDEDSSPLVQNLDLAQHIPCSTRDMRHTSGHRLAILQFAI